MNFCLEFLQEFSIVWEAISNTRKSVSSNFQTPRSWLKKLGCASFFQPTSRCLEIGGNTLPRLWSITSKTSKFVKNTPLRVVFSTLFSVFDVMKHSVSCLIYYVKPVIIIGEIQSKSSPNFMTIKITFPNLFHGSDFLCLWSLRVINEFEKSCIELTQLGLDLYSPSNASINSNL